MAAGEIPWTNAASRHKDTDHAVGFGVEEATAEMESALAGTGGLAEGLRHRRR